MLQGEHSAILSNFIKLPFGIKTFVLSIFETGFTVYAKYKFSADQPAHPCSLISTFVLTQGSHRLEKYLNLGGFLKKSLKIKPA